jgi:hypothetical protein
MDDEWRLPVPSEDPEVYKAGAAHDESGPPRLIPDVNFVEGDSLVDEVKKGPSCPFH